MKRILAILLSLTIMVGAFSACGGGDSKGEKDESKETTEQTEQAEDTEPTDEGTEGDVADSGTDEEIVDGRFVETRKITVEIYDRSNDGGTPADDNMYTDYIKEGMLRDHNVEVEFQPVPRWTETEVLNNLLAAQDAPDICVTYSYPTIQAYANMGGVQDLNPIIEENKDLIPDLVELITEDNLYFNQDPETGKIWAIEARLFHGVGLRTFVREDWLKKLDIPEPTTFEEFEEMLHAFKDNAETLLGDDASMIVPYWITSDAGWHLNEMADAFLPTDVTDKDLYIYGFDDRKLLYPNYKELVRLVNKWYNDGLLWSDFALYDAADEAGGNILKQGFAGAYNQGHDDPYRNGEDGIQQNMVRLANEDAAFTTITPFENSEGQHKKILGSPVDRKVFFPVTNDEPVASLMYLNWITKLENRVFLQTGEEGVNHEINDEGAYVELTVEAGNPNIMNSPKNIDYTITYNGLNLGDEELTQLSLAQGYAGIDSKYILDSLDLSDYDEVYYLKNIQTGEIASEQGKGEALSGKRDALLSTAIVAAPDKFDGVFDAAFQDYLSSGGQAIIDERTAAWEKVYGDKVNLD